MLYTEWALKEPNIPTWTPTSTQMPGALSPARLEPEFRLHSQSHGFSDLLTVDQLLTPIQVTEKKANSVTFFIFNLVSFLFSFLLFR